MSFTMTNLPPRLALTFARTRDLLFGELKGPACRLITRRPDEFRSASVMVFIFFGKS